MYLRAKKRIKDGKEHRYWSIVESCRNLDGRVVQRQVLYLGEINDSQKTAWCRTIEVLQVDSSAKQMALFPADRPAPELECEVVQVKLNELRLHHPRQWGACWLALTLWEQLELDRFWHDRLPASRQGTKWLEVLKTQVCYQLIDPGSEWRLHRHWYTHSAMRDLLGSPVRVLSDDTLYRCLDKLLAHKRAFFSFLRQRWEVLFQARFDVLLYDLTSTYFESDPPFAGKRQFGYSRDKRSDCVQVVIALVVTPQGFPLAAAAVRDENVIVTPPPPPRHFDVMAEAARPHAEEIVRVVGALLDEQTNEWQVTGRYMSREVLANFIDPNNPQALLEARYAA